MTTAQANFVYHDDEGVAHRVRRGDEIPKEALDKIDNPKITDEPEGGSDQAPADFGSGPLVGRKRDQLDNLAVELGAGDLETVQAKSSKDDVIALIEENVEPDRLNEYL